MSFWRKEYSDTTCEKHQIWINLNLYLVNFTFPLFHQIYSWVNRKSELKLQVELQRTCTTTFKWSCTVVDSPSSAYEDKFVNSTVLGHHIHCEWQLPQPLNPKNDSFRSVLSVLPVGARQMVDTESHSRNIPDCFPASVSALLTLGKTTIASRQPSHVPMIG